MPCIALSEFSEADAVVCLCPVVGDRFGYALANGIVGLYQGAERQWRIKVGEGGGGVKAFLGGL